MFEPFFVLEGVGLLDSRDAIRRHGAEGSLNTERVWVVLAGSSSILSKRQNVPISHIVERAVPISHKRKIPVPLNHNPPFLSVSLMLLLGSCIFTKIPALLDCGYIPTLPLLRCFT